MAEVRKTTGPITCHLCSSLPYLAAGVPADNTGIAGITCEDVTHLASRLVIAPSSYLFLLLTYSSLSLLRLFSLLSDVARMLFENV